MKNKFFIKAIVIVFCCVFAHTITHGQAVYCPPNPAVAPGSCASQLGYQTWARGDNSFASGYQSVANGNNSFALGNQSVANGNNSFALGNQSNANGNNSFALGYQSVANDFLSVSIGQNCFSGRQAYSFGQNARAVSEQSVAIGRYIETQSVGAMVIGSSMPDRVLVNNINHSLMIGFNSTIPTVFVSESATTQSFGKVGIGTTNPATTLDVNGDVTVRNLANDDDTKIVTTDRDGKLTLTDFSGLGVGGDNMGDHIATKNITLGEFVISRNNYNSKDSQPTRADGSSFCPGLHYKGLTDTLLVFEPGGTPKFAVIGGREQRSSIWVGNWNDGGYGLVFNGGGEDEDKKSGGIYRDANSPTPVIGIRDYKVGIGFIPSDAEAETNFNLFVPGGILTEEVLIKLRTENNEYNWPDYVFNSDYKVMPLKELETFIKQEKHLPEIPTASEIAEKGISVSEMNALLLKKIEELTIYVIELGAENEVLKSKVEKLYDKLNN